MSLLDKFKARRRAKRLAAKRARFAAWMEESKGTFGTDITGMGMSLETKTAWAADVERGTHLVEVIPAYYNEDGTTNTLEEEIEDKIDEWHLAYGGPLDLHEYLGWTWDEYKTYVETGKAPDAENS